MPIMLQANAQAVNGVLYETNTIRMAVSTEHSTPPDVRTYAHPTGRARHR
jgi:hypothetical protein